MLLTSYIYEKGFFDNQNRWKVRLHWERLHKILLQESQGHLASKLILNNVRKLASKWLRSLEFGKMSWVFKLLDGIEEDYFSDTPLRALTTINIDSDQVVRPKKEALLERTLQNNLTRIMKVDWKDKSREMKIIPPSFSEKDKSIMQQIMTNLKLHSVHQLGILPYVMKLKKEEDNVIIEFYRQYPSVTYPYAQQCGNGKEYFFSGENQGEDVPSSIYVVECIVNKKHLSDLGDSIQRGVCTVADMGVADKILVQYVASESLVTHLTENGQRRDDLKHLIWNDISQETK